jgi:hypothetical protein
LRNRRRLTIRYIFNRKKYRFVALDATRNSPGIKKHFSFTYLREIMLDREVVKFGIFRQNLLKQTSKP